MKTIETDARGMSLQGGINGGMMRRPEGYEDRAWMNYVLVRSVDAAIGRAQKLGASVMKGKSAVPGMGWFAMLNDPEGNLFSIWQPDSKAK
jgi:predicted enzyme related to lactoylglutathione lyase